MKITITHNDSKKQLLLSTRTMERLLERIAKEDARQKVTRFRENVPYLEDGYRYYKEMATWARVYPAAEFVKDENDNLKMKACNGILMLRFTDITDPDGVEGVKRAAARMPSTLAAIEGADAKSVIVLVMYENAEGPLPADEGEAELLYRIAYQQIHPAYQAMVRASLQTGDVLRKEETCTAQSQRPSLRDYFLMTLDPHPYYNPKAASMSVDVRSGKRFLEQDEDCQGGLEENAAGKAVGAGADDGAGDERDGGSVRDNILSMTKLLNDKYMFRYNTVMKYVEYMPKVNGWFGFRPVDSRVRNRMTLEVQTADINVSVRDVRNYLESDYIRNYSPIEEYLFQCSGKWDGKDHIRALARTVPTNNPHWEDWFYTWFLGMVNQWRYYLVRQYGNSVVPLLISKQGYNKSTFCRRLLPTELQWGYTDNLVLSEKRQVFQAMSQFMLINLDEFNQISPQVQQGFLKNIIQLPAVKMKRPYGGHVEEFPRMASFIATSNMTDILTDPSGNRRFIGIELTGPIDVSVMPNHCQLYAQAMAALDNGEKCYFDSEQTKLIMKSNCQFELEQPVDQYFRLFFDVAENESDGVYMTGAEIFDVLKKAIGSSLKANTLMGFGRKLANMPDLKGKRFAEGRKYLVKRRDVSL